MTHQRINRIIAQKEKIFFQLAAEAKARTLTTLLIRLWNLVTGAKK